MQKFNVLGDTHLGRKFRTGVPLDRIGDREALVWEQFETELLGDHGVGLHIHMGDLFDKFVVPPEVVIRAANIYQQAAEKNPNTIFVVLMGNHDTSRDVTKRSSFDLFEALVRDIENIVVVKDQPEEIGAYGFIPYSAFRPTTELVAELSVDVKTVFGHWDVQDWGGDNVIPTELLAERGVLLAYTGHDHIPREETRHGVDIVVVGSMQPYSHAEDRVGDWYVTLRLDELDDQCVRDKNVRLLLSDGEEPPADLECLSLQVRRLDSQESSLEVDTSDFDAFDLRTALSEVVNETVREDIMRIFDDAQAPAT